MNVFFCFKKLFGTAISIQSSKKILYPSITVCTQKSETPLDYQPTLNETLMAAQYRAPDGSWEAVNPLLPDVENRDKNLSPQGCVLNV